MIISRRLDQVDDSARPDAVTVVPSGSDSSAPISDDGAIDVSVRTLSASRLAP